MGIRTGVKETLGNSYQPGNPHCQSQFRNYSAERGRGREKKEEEKEKEEREEGREGGNPSKTDLGELPKEQVGIKNMY